MSIVISIVIATYNRSEYIKRSLKALANQSLDQRLFEVIIVDNASTDNTQEVVKANNQCIKNLHYIYEIKQGLNEARNTGLRKSGGKFVAYIDDDAVPHKQWAKKILEAFTTVNPQPGVVGGPTLPVWEGEKPVWLIPKFERALSMIDYGDEKRFLKGKEFLVGANMIFLKTALEGVGGFMLGLGRIKNKLLSGEDTAAIEKIKRLGYEVYYDPEIAVDHYVASSRLSRHWFIERYYWGGYSEALMWQMLDNPSAKVWLKKFGYHVYGFIRNPGHIFYLIRNPIDPEAFWFKCLVHARVGYLIGLFKNINK